VKEVFLPRLEFPNGRTFAFTIIDDTDIATVENLKPVYDLIHGLGMRTTKTVWPLSCDDPQSNFAGSETLQDPEYLQFILDLKGRGFEITWHAAAMESSERSQTLLGLERFREKIGHYPRIHTSHALNRENPYWGADRVDFPLIRWLMRRQFDLPGDHFLGHVEGSAYWWGDACTQHIEYGRNLTFSAINLASVNPSMPYRDPRRPLIRYWFSASDAPAIDDFRQLLRPENQDRLEREGGFCIVATHLGKGFAPNGRLDPGFERDLETLAARPGWFPTVGELLDWLLTHRVTTDLPRTEWLRMQFRWLMDAVTRQRAYKSNNRMA
jgi:hypothetical protein